MTVKEFVKHRRGEIDEYIRKAQRLSRLPYRLNDDERIQWLLNDDVLYRWALAFRVRGI